MGETANFVWDDRKEAGTVAERRLGFAIAEVLLSDPRLIDAVPTYPGSDEARWMMIGSVPPIPEIGLVHDAVLVCVYARRDRKRRIVSLRMASRKERDTYERSR